jgi:hypothetical protein
VTRERETGAEAAWRQAREEEEAARKDAGDEARRGRDRRRTAEASQVGSSPCDAAVPAYLHGTAAAAKEETAAHSRPPKTDPHFGRLARLVLSSPYLSSVIVEVEAVVIPSLDADWAL